MCLSMHFYLKWLTCDDGETSFHAGSVYWCYFSSAVASLPVAVSEYAAEVTSASVAALSQQNRPLCVEHEKCVTHLDAMAQAIQLLVVDWSATVRWAGLRTGRRRREDLVATWNTPHRREGANFSP